ncbi:hypothetical protein Tco_1296065, partial [Tanacetum coccineum]
VLSSAIMEFLRCCGGKVEETGGDCKFIMCLGDSLE